MPKLDLTVTISVILALCATITPSITTFLNNRHQLKMKKLELELQEKKELLFYRREVYENYLKYTMRCIHRDDNESAHLYDEYYALALIYFPSELTPVLMDINQCVTTRNGFQSLDAFNELSKNVRGILKTM